MIIIRDAIVSNSEMIKNYKACREKAETFGRVFVLKNNQPDAVLFSLAEYEKISEIIEKIGKYDQSKILKIVESLEFEDK